MCIHWANLLNGIGRATGSTVRDTRTALRSAWETVSQKLLRQGTYCRKIRGKLNENSCSTVKNKAKQNKEIIRNGFIWICHSHINPSFIFIILSLVHVVFIGAGMQAWRQAYVNMPPYVKFFFSSSINFIINLISGNCKCSCWNVFWLKPQKDSTLLSFQSNTLCRNYTCN